MREIFYVYLQNSLQLSLIITLMLFLSPILAHRYSAKCRYYLWTVVFAALLFPMQGNIKLTLPEFLQAAVPQEASNAVTVISVTNAVTSWDWLQYAGLLWIAGSAAFLIWHLFSHLRFLSAVRRWSEDLKNENILITFERIKEDLRIRKYISIKVCACIKTPMVVGMLCPVILLPQTPFSQDELPLILKHELVHIKRKDLWYKVLMLSALAIHWFNPMIHLAVRSVLNLCEISCDEEVLKGIDAKGRARYGESVIGTVRNSNAYKTALSTNLLYRLLCLLSLKADSNSLIKLLLLNQNRILWIPQSLPIQMKVIRRIKAPMTTAYLQMNSYPPIMMPLWNQTKRRPMVRMRPGLL